VLELGAWLTAKSIPGSAPPVVREVRLPGISLLTLPIKVAGGRELVMVHLGATESHSRAVGRSIPQEGRTSSRFDRSVGLFE
jgi:hypothetical protein